MHIELRKSGDVIIVDLKGKLSAGLGDQILRETIDELLGENWKKILLNLSQVSFMDSAGLGELVAGLKTARNFGATLKILNQSARVQQSLYITRLLPVFDIHEDERAALESFGNSGGESSRTHPPVRCALPPTRSLRSESVARCLWFESFLQRGAHADGSVPGDLQLDRALRAVERLPQ